MSNAPASPLGLAPASPSPQAWGAEQPSPGLAPASPLGLAPASPSPQAWGAEQPSPFANYLEEMFYYDRIQSSNTSPSPSIYQVSMGMFENVPVHCPLCSNEMTFGNYFIHLAEAHPITYNFWMYFYQPQYTNPYPDVDTMSYEDLLNLCQTIGNHSPGLTSEEKESATQPYNPTPDEEADPPKCPVCLISPEPATATAVRLKRCRHVFCQSCIYEWLETHKTCPLCIQEVLCKE